jgi:hypothetical protein
MPDEDTLAATEAANYQTAQAGHRPPDQPEPDTTDEPDQAGGDQ